MGFVIQNEQLSPLFGGCFRGQEDVSFYLKHSYLLSFFLRGVGQLGSSRMIVHITDFVRRLLLQTKQHRSRRTEVTWNMCQLRIDITFFLFEFNLEIDKKNLSNPENATLFSVCEPNGHLTSTDRKNLRAQGVHLIKPPKLA